MTKNIVKGLEFLAIQIWKKFVDFKKTKGKNAPNCLKEQKEKTHEPPSSEIGEVEEVVHEEDQNSLPSDSEKYERHHMSIKKFLLKILKIISRHILPWKWNKENLMIDAWTMKEYLLMSAHTSILVI